MIAQDNGGIGALPKWGDAKVNFQSLGLHCEKPIRMGRILEKGELQMERDRPTETNRRAQERFAIRAPLTMRLGTTTVAAITRDLSNNGVYFYSKSSDIFQIDQELDFVIEVPPELTLTHDCEIHCHGRTVRTDQMSSNETGVAAAILDYSIVQSAAFDSARIRTDF